MLSKYAMLGFVAILFAAKWPHEDSQVLQGTWEIVSVARSGVDDPSPVGYTLKFVGDEVHFQVPLDEPMKLSTYKIEPITDEQMNMMRFS